MRLSARSCVYVCVYVYKWHTNIAVRLMPRQTGTHENATDNSKSVRAFIENWQNRHSNAITSVSRHLHRAGFVQQLLLLQCFQLAVFWLTCWWQSVPIPLKVTHPVLMTVMMPSARDQANKPQPTHQLQCYALLMAVNNFRCWSGLYNIHKLCAYTHTHTHQCVFL